ncbi:E3 SUMO-protein ligase ZBED1-like [Polyergus mexicanus]|uniref:E3 SUMO-protein ligase ZBED1-like n=1 Tax=Polyergus mexicanus TaxID=615972 RepID=UPI0038B66CB0
MTVTQIIDVKYDLLSLKIKEKIKEINAMSLTTDIWTDTLNTKSYLGLTGHFIDEEKLQSITFGVTELEERHNAEYLISAVVTDNGSNIVKTVVDLYGKNKHFPCFAHTLILMANKPFNEKNGLNNVKVLLGFMELYLLPTREIKLADKIAPILLSNSKALPMLTAAQLDALKDLIQIYESLEVFTKEVLGENYVTSSKIIPMIYCLNKSIGAVQPNTILGYETKTIIINEIHKRFGAIEQVHSLAISTLLDPRFKKIYFIDKIACFQAISKTTLMLSAVETEIETNQFLPLDESTRSLNVKDVKSAGNIWRFHRTLVKENQPVEDLKKCDPVKYWCIHKDTMYKKISKIVYKYMCIVGTSVPSERLFSIAGNIVTPSRNRLSGKRLQKLIFLKSLDEKHWNIK